MLWYAFYAFKLNILDAKNQNMHVFENVESDFDMKVTNVMNVWMQDIYVTQQQSIYILSLDLQQKCEILDCYNLETCERCLGSCIEQA